MADVDDSVKILSNHKATLSPENVENISNFNFKQFAHDDNR